VTRDLGHKNPIDGLTASINGAIFKLSK